MDLITNIAMTWSCKVVANSDPFCCTSESEVPKSCVYALGDAGSAHSFQIHYPPEQFPSLWVILVHLPVALKRSSLVAAKGGGSRVSQGLDG